MQKRRVPVNIKVAGTTPLSFEVSVGAQLSVKQYSPSVKARPSVGGRFKNSAYILFKGMTKVGRLTPANLNKLDHKVPETCTVVHLDEAKKSLIVEFE